MFDDRIERASVDGQKMEELANEMNGGSEIFGPYSVVSIELEDEPNTPLKPTKDAGSLSDKYYNKGFGTSP